MPTNRRTALQISAARKAKQDILGNAYVLLRPDNLPMLLRPKRALKAAKCAMSGKTIYTGDYFVPCYKNPIRFSPYGRDKVLMSHFNKLRDIYPYLPYGWMAAPVPRYDDVVDKGYLKKLETARRDQLYREGTKLLKAGKKRGALKCG